MGLLESAWLQVLLLIFHCVCQIVTWLRTKREDRLITEIASMAHFKPKCPIDWHGMHEVLPLLIPWFLPTQSVKEVSWHKACGSTNRFCPYSYWEQDLALKAEFGQGGLEKAAVKTACHIWITIPCPSYLSWIYPSRLRCLYGGCWNGMGSNSHFIACWRNWGMFFSSEFVQGCRWTEHDS